jgi:hypothetical protein
MRIFKLSMALALLAGGLGLTTTASAQRDDHRRDRIETSADYRRDVLGIPGGGDRQLDRSDRRGNDRGYNRSNRRNDRATNRSDRRDWRRDGYRNSNSCKTVWRNQRRVRVCR